MIILEVIIVGIVLVFIVTYRTSTGGGVYKFVNEQANRPFAVVECP